MTVWGEMISACAISLLLNRCARSARTSRSRSVSGSTSSGRPMGGTAAVVEPLLVWRSGCIVAECLQDLARIAWSDARAPQSGKQPRHSWPQVDEETNEAARLGQQHGLFQQRERRPLVPLRVLKQRLQRQHLDREARVMGGRHEVIQPRQVLRRPAAGWRACSDARRIFGNVSCGA